MSSSYYQQPYQYQVSQHGHQAPLLAPRQPSTSYDPQYAARQDLYSMQAPETQFKPEYICLYPECWRAGVGFTRYAGLQRHVEAIHNRQSLSLVDCEVSGCRRTGSQGFTRRDKMIDHMREVHKMPIPKRPAGKKST